MKKLLFFLLLIPFLAHSQVDTTKQLQPVNSFGFRYKSVSIDTFARAPRDTFKLRVSDSGSFAYKGGNWWLWTGFVWKLSSGSGSSGIGDTTALMRKANNLGDISSASAARTNLGLGTGAVKNVPASGNAASTELVMGNDSRLAPTLTITPGPTVVAYGLSNGTGNNLGFATSVNAGAESPDHFKQLDSLRRFSDSIRITRKPGTDSVFIGVTPVNTGVETLTFQYRDTLGTGGGGGITDATGDATGTVSGVHLPLTLASVNSNVGTFGDATHVAQTTYDSKGRATAVVNVAIPGATTNLTYTPASTNGQVNSSTGSPVVLPGGTESAAGLISAIQVQRLNTGVYMRNLRASRSDSIATSKISTTSGIPDTLSFRGEQDSASTGILITDLSTTNTIIRKFTVDTSTNVRNALTQGRAGNTYTPMARTITINGVPHDLTADVSFTVGSGFTNPMSAVGDAIYGGAAGVATRLAGNTTAVKQFFTQTGTGSASAAPAWYTITGADIGTWLGYTAESVSNKSTSTSLGTSNTLYPTQNAVKAYADAIGTGLASSTTTFTNKTISGSSNTFTAIALTTAVTGILPVANGGSGSGSLSGYIFGNATSAFTASTTIPGAAISGAIAGNSANVTGVVGLSHGGTNVDMSATGGTGFVLKQNTVGGNISAGLLTVLGTVTSGDITAILPQGLGVASIPSFNGINIGRFQSYPNGSPNPGVVPTVGAGAGTGATFAISGVQGTDVSGDIIIITGTSPSANAVVATCFQNSVPGSGYPNGMTVILYPANVVTMAAQVYTIGTTTNFTINTGASALTASTTYRWHYVIQGF